MLTRLRLIDLAERRSFLDPHGGKGGTVKAGLARAAIVDIARDPFNRFWVLDSWAGRVSTTEMIEEMIRHFHKWHPAQFGVDATAQQSLFVDTVRPLLRLRGEVFSVVGIPASTRADKVYRIRTILQPVISEHRLLVGSNLLELRAELAAFPTGKTVDIVDALASCITMFPSGLSTVQDEADADADYETYLRDCGLPEDEIAKRIQEE